MATETTVGGPGWRARAAGGPGRPVPVDPGGRRARPAGGPGRPLYIASRRDARVPIELHAPARHKAAALQLQKRRLAIVKSSELGKLFRARRQIDFKLDNNKVILALMTTKPPRAHFPELPAVRWLPLLRQI